MRYFEKLTYLMLNIFMISDKFQQCVFIFKSFRRLRFKNRLYEAEKIYKICTNKSEIMGKLCK